MSGQRALARRVVPPLQPGPPRPSTPAGRSGPHRQAGHRRTHRGQATVPILRGERQHPLPKSELPRIFRKPTIAIRPGDLGKHDNFRQDRHYLHPTWQDAYRPERANIEGLNGWAKSHGVDISDPTKRLAHGRVAQAILLAPMICSINLHILFSWHRITGARAPATTHEVAPIAGPAARPLDAAGLASTPTARRSARPPETSAPPAGTTHAGRQSKNAPRTRTTPKLQADDRQATAHGTEPVRTTPRASPGNAEIPPDQKIGQDLVNFLSEPKNIRAWT
ncbi:hypothetical protein [Streptomyces albidoflavus]|uniref:hypothetical protein n=1 Tax=Streptomyces albidoflavus TaxID=1886 RepID=UPI0033C262D3